MSLNEDVGDLSEDEVRYLRLLRDEGLDLLAKFRMIGDSKKRRMIIEMAAMFADDQPPCKLDGSY